MWKFLVSIFLLVLLWRCGGGSDEFKDPVDTSKIDLSVDIERLESQIFKLKSKKDIEGFLDKYEDFSTQYLQRGKVPDSVIIRSFQAMIKEKHIKDTLYKATLKKYDNKAIQKLKKEFEDAFKHIKYYYPSFKAPKIYTTITGIGSFMGNDLFMSRDIIVISLDFFIGGKDAPYHPPSMPEYIWKRYHEKAIVPTFVQFISNQYNKTDLLDKSLMAEMVYYGKTYQFVKTMIPQLEDSILAGYTRDEVKLLKNKEYLSKIWTHFIEEDILFSTKQIDIRDYIGEGPYLARIYIKPKCPGRVGRWIGWQIVQNYLKENPKVKFEDLMKEKNAKTIFNKSGYKGN